MFSGSPLSVRIGEQGQIQAVREDGSGIFYPSTSAIGDAGFFIAFPADTTPAPPAAVSGQVYGFDGFAGPFGLASLTPVSQAPVSGAGVAGDPLAQVTVYDVNPDGTPIASITQTTTYVNGAQEFRVSWSVTNVSGALLPYKALVAADFFFEGSDRGTGIFTVGPPRFVGGTNVDTGASGGFVEVTPPWSAYQGLEFGFDASQVWGKVAAAASAATPTFDDTVVGEQVDDAGGVEWDDQLAQPLSAGATATYSLVIRSAVPSALQVNPTNAGAPQGVPITFTVTATDSNGQPYSGRTLRFTILGANPQTGAATLDAGAHDGLAFGDQVPVPEPAVLFGQADQ